MLRQNSLQTRGMATTKTEIELLEEAAEIESLRAAYMAVVGNSGRVVSGSAMKQALHSMLNTVPAPVLPVQPAPQETFQIPMQAPVPNQQVSPQAPLEAAIQALVKAIIQPPVQPIAQTSVPVPVQAPTLAPIDAAIEAIAQAEYEQSVALTQQSMPPQPIFVESPQPAVIAAALRNQYNPQRQADFVPKAIPVMQSAPVYSVQPDPIAVNHSQVEIAKTVASEVPASPSQASVSLAIIEEPSSIPVPDSLAPQTNPAPRSIKLPKFLMGDSAEQLAQPLFSDLPKIAPAMSTPKLSASQVGDTPDSSSSQSGKMTVFADEIAALSQPAHQSLPPLPQALFSEAPAESIHTLPKSKAAPFSKQNSKQKKDTDVSFSSVIPAAAILSTMDVHPVDDQSAWASQYQHYESAWVKLFERPRLLLGVLGLGIVSCSVYIALGYWWFGASPISQAAEPVNMLNVNDTSKAESDNNPTSAFNNIRSIQQNSHSEGNQGSSSFRQMGKPAGILLAQSNPVAGFSSASPLPSPEPVKSEPLGRVDPFAPLISGTSAPSGQGKEEIKKDILADVQYTGFIGDINSRDKVALIKVNDTVSGVSKTMIKKAGDTLSVNGERVVVKAISKKTLYLSAQGESRQLGIQQYQAIKAVPAQAPATPGGATGALGAPAAGTPGSTDPSQPVLSEPKG